MRTKACYRFVVLLVLTCSLLFGNVLNGGFEDAGGSLAEWTVFGTVQASAGNDYPPQINPDAGSTAARIISGAIGVADLETDLGLQSGDLGMIADGDAPTVGSAISQTINVLAGQYLTFRWNYASSESFPFNDYSFFGYALNGGGSGVFRLSSADELPPFGQDDSVKVSGWQTGSYLFAESGQYTIFFGSLDAGDTIIPSDLWIDSVGLGDGAAIPEPSALVLSGLGLLGVLALRKRLPLVSR